VFRRARECRTDAAATKPQFHALRAGVDLANSVVLRMTLQDEPGIVLPDNAQSTCTRYTKLIAGPRDAAEVTTRSWTTRSGEK